jgi:hypothetical protein
VVTDWNTVFHVEVIGLHHIPEKPRLRIRVRSCRAARYRPSPG